MSKKVCFFVIWIFIFTSAHALTYAETVQEVEQETVQETVQEEFQRLDMKFFSSPKLGGGNLTQGSIRYHWSPRYSSRLGFAYATETFNVEYEDDKIVDSLGLVTNNEYRLDIVPYEVLHRQSRWALGVNTTVESTNEYGFYRAGNSVDEDGYFLSFEESRLRVFVSPRVGWELQASRGAVSLRSQFWLSPIFLASLDERYRYEYDNTGEQEQTTDGIGFGYPEIEIDASIDFGRFFRLDLAMIYRYFLLDELDLLVDANGNVFFNEVETEYDILRLLVAGSLPISLPNGTTFRVGAGLLLYMERNLTERIDRLEPGVSLIFGVE